MKLLSKDQKLFIFRQMYNKERDIDVAIINIFDDSMPKDFMLDALMFYQNNDGGFANGLYIDNYNVNTSVYQIYEAYRLLDMVGFDSSCGELELYYPIMNKSMNYLYNREQPINNKWNPNTKTNNDFAHSKEFEYCEENTKLFGYHPTAAILGYTLVFANNTKAYYKKALKMSEIMINDLLNMDSLTKYEFISFNSFLNSIKKANVFADKQEQIEAHLIKLAKEVVSVDFNDLDAIQPLDCVLYLNDDELNEKINLQLDDIIDNLKSHGLWEKKGDWGYNKYAEEDSAKLKWIGAETVNNYFILKKYGRLA